MIPSDERRMRSTGDRKRRGKRRTDYRKKIKEQ